jgi:integrase
MMPSTDPLPDCLRRSDAGGHVQTRTAETEARYRVRFASMLKTLCRRHRWAEADAYDLAVDLGERASCYSRNSLKQFHAAIRQNLRDRWSEGSIEVDEVEHIDALLQTHTPAPRRKSGVPALTSAGRPKSAGPGEISAIVGVLLRDATPIRQIAAGLLEYGIEFATRPSEFLSLTRTANGGFIVRSAKYSTDNRRGLQPVHALPLEHLEPHHLAELKHLARLIAAERADGATTHSLLRRCQHAIRIARAEIGDGSSRITAYTVRHQARANCVAMGMTPEEVAVLMGHANADTAQAHYGRVAWSGLKGATPPRVSPDLVAIVRPPHPSRGWPGGRDLEGGNAPRF